MSLDLQPQRWLLLHQFPDRGQLAFRLVLDRRLTGLEQNSMQGDRSFLGEDLRDA
jgi:hypothetical protein